MAKKHVFLSGCETAFLVEQGGPPLQDKKVVILHTKNIARRCWKNVFLLVHEKDASLATGNLFAYEKAICWGQKKISFPLTSFKMKRLRNTKSAQTGSLKSS